ncbi:late competence development ComFB family protein [Clostridium sp. YIM B02515]|uniref:Late competence development ComFB family protein n=1 Tax=Clostridium rhizosphaerae TaxID=2803861 RepID=A0ABS1T8M9_9CLOT|nr:late competence development ComFB family protein [Clostridium rhizosphaerae]MBL4935684.1 late competence development ComFB family protein [Clostridium rhizosphaerae]
MYHLKNYMEILVDEILPGMLVKENTICKCERCIMDIKAIALNRLPAKYIVSDIGEIYRRYDELGKQLEIDVMEAIMRAIELVKLYPKHDA